MGQEPVLHPLNVKAHKPHSLDGSLEAPSVGLREEELPLTRPMWRWGLGAGHARFPMKPSFLLFLPKSPPFVCLRGGLFDLSAGLL